MDNGPEWLSKIPRKNLYEILYFGDVAVASYYSQNSAWTIAYKGSRKYQISDFVGEILRNGKFIVFEVFTQSKTIVLDTENWTVKAFGIGSPIQSFDKWIVFADVFGNKLLFVSLDSTKERFEVPVGEFPGYVVHSSAYSPIGNILVVEDGNGGGYVVDVSSRKSIAEKMFTGGMTYAMAFSPNGRLFATYGTDGFVRVWAVIPEEVNVRQEY